MLTDLHDDALLMRQVGLRPADRRRCWRMTYYVPARLAPGYRSILTHVELRGCALCVLVQGMY